MNGKPRKKKDTTISTMPGVTLTPEQLTAKVAHEVYPYLMGLSYAFIAELIDVLVAGGMPQETAKIRAVEIANSAMMRFKANQERATIL